VTGKVGALHDNLGDPAFPRIAYRPGTNGRPTPVLRGAGTRVQTLAVAATRWGMEPSDIAREFGLPVSVVHEALAFFAAHRDEVESLIAADEIAETDASATPAPG
jgi:uncharacterized protein (DUF433 family)